MVDVFLKTGMSIDEVACVDVLQFLPGPGYSLQAGRGNRTTNGHGWQSAVFLSVDGMISRPRGIMMAMDCGIRLSSVLHLGYGQRGGSAGSTSGMEAIVWSPAITLVWDTGRPGSSVLLPDSGQ